MSSYQGHRFGIATPEKGSSINQGLYHGAVNVFVDSRWYTVKWSQSFTSEVLLRSFCREEKFAWLA